MNSQNVGTDQAGRLAAPVPKVEYFRFAPSASRYHRVMKLAGMRGCDWQEIVRNAIDFFLEFQEKRVTIIKN